jgi:glycine/D-amino acid oxidase-like deaminating enzyme
VPGYGHRYWAERTRAARRRTYPALRRDTTADVVVIGGGLTGATAAYVLASAGLDVVLVEAERLAGGGTANGLGAILPEPAESFRDVEAACGRRVARTAWRETRRSMLDMAAAIRRLPAHKDLASSALVINARQPEDATVARKDQTARKAAGLDAPWLAPAAATLEVGARSSGALRFREAFVHDPVRTALAFATAATEKGARIHERSAVRRTTFTRKEATVVLAGGTIRTRHVFVATATPGRLFGQLRRHVQERDAFVVVTEPLSPAMRREAGRMAAVLTEAGADRHWLRWLPEHRAMFGGALSDPVSPRLQDRTLVQRTGQLMYELSVRYPIISGLPSRWSWRLPLSSTVDGLPWVGPHRNYPFHFFALAFGWHGDGLAWFAAKAALRQFTNEERAEDKVFWR